MTVPPNITTYNRHTGSYTLVYRGTESGSNLDRGAFNLSPCEYQIYTDVNSLAYETGREVQSNIPLASKDPNIPLHVCKYSAEKTYSTRDIGTQTVRKCYSESSTLLPAHKKKGFLSPPGIELAMDVLCSNISVALPTILSSSYGQVRILHT